MATTSANLQAATITVSNTADNGPGSLRAAIALAANGDTITFSVMTPATITITSGELSLTKSLTIFGPGDGNLAVDGNHVGRVFHIAPSNAVTISSVTIAHGLAAGNYPSNLGGGIYNDHATLTISNCTLSGNSTTNGWGGAIFNEAANGSARLRILNSTLSGNSATHSGGGIYNNGYLGSASVQIVSSALSSNLAVYGGGIINGAAGGGSASLEIINSTLSGNSGGQGDGGAIDNDGSGGGSVSLQILNSTLSNNSAGGGGGIMNDGRFSGSATLQIANSTLNDNSSSGGGGIYSAAAGGGSAIMQIVNSTFSGNSAAGGGGSIAINGFHGSANSRVANSTFSGNSALGEGGIYNFAASLEIGSTILHDSGSAANIGNNSGTVSSLGYNLSSDDGGGFLTATGDQINTDPLLGPLQDNGGTTFTHAPLAGSPTIDKGKNFSTLATDQRGAGFARTIDNPGQVNATEGDGTDIGAVEVQAFSPCEAISLLIATVESSSLPRNRQQPLIVSLTAACASLGKGRPILSANQLHAFQNKVLAQVTPFDPVLAQNLIDKAQVIINALIAQPQ